MKKTVRYFGIIEAILVLALLGGGYSGFKNIKKEQKLTEQGDLIVDQSKEIHLLSIKIDETSNELKKTNDHKETLQKKLETDVKRDFSIVFEQAKDIQGESETPYTDMHLDTLKEMIRTYGYDAMAQIFKWNMDTIRQQQIQTRELIKEKEELKIKYHDLEKQHMLYVSDSVVKTKEHEKEAITLKNKIDNFLKDGGFLDNVIFWGSIGIGIYIFISLGGVGFMIRTKNKIKSQAEEAIEVGESYRRKLNANNKLIRTFADINEDGNDTMSCLLKSQEIDINTKIESPFKKK